MKKQKRVFASNFHCIGMQLVAAVLCFMDIVCVVFFHNHRSLVIGETELTVLPFPLLCMRAQQHGQNTNISPYQHGSALMQVCTKFCKAKGDFLFIYFAQVLSNIEC